MKIRSRFQVLSAVLLASVVAISSCSKKSSDPAHTAYLGSVAKFKGLDPIQSDDRYSAIELSYAYEGLLQYHYLKRPYVLIPNLAEAMPEISKDGKTYTFKLKKGVLFHDDACFKETQGKGRELTADDVIYSWKRLADPRNVSPNWWTLDGKIVGLNEWHDAAAKATTTDYSKPVEGLKALDRYTVQVTLSQPNSLFLYMLAMPSSYIVAHEAVELYGKEFINHAVGTGPFRLNKFSPEKTIWDRNPTFRKELYPSEGAPGDQELGLLADAGKPIPFLDRIVTTAYEEDQPSWLNFMAGKKDYSSIPKDNYKQAMSADGKSLSDELKAKKVRLSITVAPDLTHVTFNMADPVLGKNKLLRQALSLAYDTDQLIELFYNGRAIPAQGPIPPGLPGYDPNFKNPYRQYNLAKAKELLKKAGYPNGEGLPTFEYLNLPGTTERQFGEYLEKAWGELGVHIKANTYSWPEFTAKLKSKSGQVWEYAWYGDYPDAENFLQLFYGKNVSPGPNDSNYVNPAFDKLYEKSLTLTNEAERLAVYRQMVDIVAEDMPFIFAVHRKFYYVSQPWLKNFKYSDFELSMAKYFRVDPTLKK